tara:strand:+ start:337 stop:456 length:120 start_codon:yes stop_codon:yes gene_type:complete
MWAMLFMAFLPIILLVIGTIMFIFVKIAGFIIEKLIGSE